MKKVCLIVICLLFIILGCYPKNTEGPSIKKENNDEKKKITFINSWGGTDSNAVALQSVFDEFMQENPDVFIENESIGGEDFLKTIKTNFATNNDPDVFGIWPGSDMTALIEAGKVADLTELMQSNMEWKNSFGEEAWDLASHDGRVYGLPVEIIYEALFINTVIFEEYGVEPPESFEDLCILARLFATKGIVPIAYNFQAEGTYLYQNIVAQLGGESGVREVSSSYKEAMYKMQELYNLRAFSEDAYRLSNDQRNTLFLDEKAAMIVQGSWFTRDIYENGLGDKVDIVPFPKMNENDEGYTLVYGLGAGTFFISKKAWDDEQKRQICIALLKKLTSKETSIALMSGSGFISNIDLSSLELQQSSLCKLGMDLIKNATQLAPPPDSIVERDLWENKVVPNFSQIYDYGDEGIENLWEYMSEDNG